MIRALYVKCQLGEMMKMIKGHQSETETYMLVRGLKWADSGKDGGLRVVQLMSGKINKE